MKICVIIPAYNSEHCIAGVLESVLHHSENVIVVNDGSTDGTAEILRHIANITAISYTPNRGKGYALNQGFRRAISLGFTHAITMDADGQHLANDIPVLIQKATENPDTIVIGSRRFNNPNIPKGSRFANRFSNFWFMLQTGKRLPDTQTGYRVYPLQKAGRIQLYTRRYEAELELLVRCAWCGIPIMPQEINVHYPPQNERLSHFRTGRDFVRISVLNTVLCVLAVFYGYPAMFIRRFFYRKTAAITQYTP